MSSGGQSEITVPALGESISEATVARWLKLTGDRIKADDVLVELETDKVTVEVSSPLSGVLREVRRGNGAVVLVGDVLGLVVQEESIGEGQETMTQKATQAKISKSALSDLQPQPSAAFPPLEIEKTEIEMETSAAPIGAPIEAALEKLSPAVRKLSEELAINPKEVLGTGKGNRVTKKDIISFAEGKSGGIDGVAAIGSGDGAPPGRVSHRREERVKMTRLRQRIAERLKEAQNTAAILTTFNEADMTAVTGMRSKYKEEFERKNKVRLGVMSFFVKACIQALKEFPAVNAEIEGDEIVYKNYYDIGVAVSTPQGLVVPVVRNADLLSFGELEKEIASLAHKARDGKLSIAEITGGTFTISNGGVFGSLLATPILNPPQTGILGMHKIEDRPVVVHGKVEIRPMMYLALSYDHRVIDGRESVAFLVRVKENLENPERLLLDM